MSIVKIEVSEHRCRPVSRRGLMMQELSCDMDSDQMFRAIQSMRESCKCDKWGEWLEKWSQEDKEWAEYPHPAKAE